MTASLLICLETLDFPVPRLKAQDFNGNSNSTPPTILDAGWPRSAQRRAAASFVSASFDLQLRQ